VTLVRELNIAIAAVNNTRIAAIKTAVANASTAYDKLHAALEESPALFDKPKTRTMHGVKVGFAKQKGKVTFSDEEKTIQLIRQLLPKDQATLLIRVSEEVHKPAVYDLVAKDLKRLGITVGEDGDAVVIKPMTSDVDKLVNALLKKTEEVEVGA
jgi:hypothetical protein